MSILTSRDNPRVRQWRALAKDARERRAKKRAWIEGEHLVTAFLTSGGKVEALVLSKSASNEKHLMQLDKSPVIVSDAVFDAIADTKTPAGVGAEISFAEGKGLARASSCVLLDGVQDAGNVGTILRSAAAFGIAHAVLGEGCADAWSPKVLRAAAGAHFSLQISEMVDLAAAMTEFGGRIVCTLPRDGVPLASADLSGRLGWLFGAEGKGVHDALAARATLKVTIPMPGSAESLNVSAAAAICFYEAARNSVRA